MFGLFYSVDGDKDVCRYIERLVGLSDVCGLYVRQEDPEKDHQIFWDFFLQVQDGVAWERFAIHFQYRSEDGKMIGTDPDFPVIFIDLKKTRSLIESSITIESSDGRSALISLDNRTSDFLSGGGEVYSFEEIIIALEIAKWFFCHGMKLGKGAARRAVVRKDLVWRSKKRG